MRYKRLFKIKKYGSPTLFTSEHGDQTSSLCAVTSFSKVLPESTKASDVLANAAQKVKTKVQNKLLTSVG